MKAYSYKFPAVILRHPAIISAEQWCKIIALACEKPEDHGVEETHWNRSTLRATIIKENIVDAISTTHVGNFLKKSNYNFTEEC